MSKGAPRTNAIAASKTSATKAGPVKKLAYQAPAAAADAAALKTQFDALLAKLVASGHMASA